MKSEQTLYQLCSAVYPDREHSASMRLFVLTTGLTSKFLSAAALRSTNSATPVNSLCSSASSLLWLRPTSQSLDQQASLLASLSVVCHDPRLGHPRFRAEGISTCTGSVTPENQPATCVVHLAVLLSPSPNKVSILNGDL